MGWARHDITRFAGGTSSRVGSICDAIIPGISGSGGNVITNVSTVAMVTGNLSTTHPLINCQIEVMHPMAEPSTPVGSGSAVWNAWHLDGGVSGAIGGTLTVAEAGSPIDHMHITGIPSSYNGSTISVYSCGLDFGDHVVSGGAIDVPFASDPDGLGTRQWIYDNFIVPGVNHTSWQEWSTPAVINGASGWIPLIVGFPFTSIMQPTRPATRDATEGKTGEAFGKTQRAHMWGATFSSTASNGLVVSSKMTATGMQANYTQDPAVTQPIQDYPVVFRYPNGTPIPGSTLFSGVFWDTISGDYNFDNQITITSTRPVPLTVAAITTFMNVEDR